MKFKLRLCVSHGSERRNGGDLPYFGPDRPAVHVTVCEFHEKRHHPGSKVFQAVDYSLCRIGIQGLESGQPPFITSFALV